MQKLMKLKAPTPAIRSRIVIGKEFSDEYIRLYSEVAKKAFTLPNGLAKHVTEINIDGHEKIFKKRSLTDKVTNRARSGRPSKKKKKGKRGRKRDFENGWYENIIRGGH